MNERAESERRGGPTRAQAVVAAGLALVLLHAGFRGWALFGSWFYLDDYTLLHDTTTRDLSPGLLLEPYNSSLMPGGKFLFWLVARSGPLNWPLAAAIVFTLQGIAALAALWAVLVLFGRRWLALVPLTLYLTSAMTVPAMMWFVAAVNQVPLQIAFFVSIGAWVQHLRTRRVRWLVATVVALGFGFVFYVKTLLLLPFLALFALAWFGSGRPVHRVVTLLRRYWLAIAVVTVLTAGYVAYYLSHVTGPFVDTTPTVAGNIADTMLATAFVSGIVGGPWDWLPLAPPNAFAAPPAWAVHVGWVVVSLVVIAGYLTRTRTLRAWLLLVIHLVGCFVLLVASRGPVYGAVIGLEYRYLTDAAAVAALCVGLAFIRVPGAVECSEHRKRPKLSLTHDGLLAAALIVVVAVSGVASSVRYVHIWHTQNASEGYMRTLQSELRARGAVDLVDTAVSPAVIPQEFAPNNLLHLVTPLVSDQVSYPDASNRMATVGADGRLSSVLIVPGVATEEGPLDGCGYPVGQRGRTIDLTSRAFEWRWWLRIGYLASDDSPLTVRAGDTVMQTAVLRGVNNLYVRVEGSFDEVRLDGLNPSARLCVDVIEVGQPAPGEPLS